MRFLDPKTDFAFKKIFGSEDSKDILLSFLNAVLDLDIQDLQILDPYLAPKIKGMKDTFLDVKAVNRKGETFVIEMQVLNVEGFEKRVLYNAAKAYSTQIGRAELYSQLRPVIALTITDFIMFAESEQVMSFFKLRENQRGFELSSDLEFVFVELPKFTKTEEELSDLSDKWLYFLKKAGDLQAIPQPLSFVSAIDHAFQIANKANMTQEELEAQEKREMFIGDQKNWIIKAQKKGREEGLEEGIAKGIEKGLEKGRQEAYKNECECVKRMFQQGFSLEQVQQIVKLEYKELVRIKNSL